MPRANYFRSKRVVALLLAVLIFLIMSMHGSSWFIERFYSEGLYRVICFVLHPLLNWLPFSVGDVLYIGVIVWLFYLLFRFCKLLFTRNFKPALRLLLKVFIGVETGILIFYLFWGFNYFRPSAAERLNLQDTSYTIADVKAVTRMLVDSVNATRSTLTPADLALPNQVIYQQAVNAIDTLGTTSTQFRTFVPGIKPSVLTPLLNYMSTAGYYNPFTGEAQINWQMPVFDRPFTACHEMSHQMGFGREDEANFVGYIAGVQSKDRLLKYAAYYEGTIEFLRYLRRRDSTAHHEMKAMLNTSVKQDIKTDSTYWTHYAGQIGLVSGRFYDSFLKANNQPAGMRTYNRMIRLTMAWYIKNGKVYKK